MRTQRQPIPHSRTFMKVQEHTDQRDLVKTLSPSEQHLESAAHAKNDPGRRLSREYLSERVGGGGAGLFFRVNS